MPKNKKFGFHRSAASESEKAPQGADALPAEVKAAGTSGQPEAQAGHEEVDAGNDASKQDLKSDEKHNKEKAPTRFWDILHLKAVKDNAALVRILAVCTVLGAATTLQNGLLLSAAAAAVTIPLYLIMALFFKKVPTYLYFSLALFIAAVLITPVELFANSYFAAVAKGCSYFLPITAINAVLMLDMRITRGDRRIIRALSAAIGDVLGFSVVLIVISALREVIGSGTLYGRVIPDYNQFRFDFVLLPPGAFLLLGFVLAIVQGIKLHRGKKNDDGEAQ